MSEMTEFQEFFFHHSDKNVPTPEEARRQFPEEFAELVDKKSKWMEPFFDAGKTYAEIAAHHQQNPQLCGDLEAFYKDASNLFSILEDAGEVDKTSEGYACYILFMQELALVRLTDLLRVFPK